MKKIIIALAASGGLVLTTGCGGGNESAGPSPRPVASSSAAKPTPTPAPVELTKADIAPKVQAVLRKQGTYRMTATSLVDPSDISTVMVKFTGATEDFSMSNADASVIGVGGQYYVKDGPLTGKSAKWKKYPKGLDAHTRALVELYRFQAQASRLLAGAAYSSTFAVTPGPLIDQVQTTRYAIVVDLRKAAAAKVYGNLLSTVEAVEEKTMPITALVDPNGLIRRLDYGTGVDATSVDFSNFGAKVTIARPIAK